MRKSVVILISVLFLGFALLPWIVKSLSPEPLLPEEIQLAPTQYQLTVEAAQDATIEAIRQKPSKSQVSIIGTIPPITQPEEAGMLEDTPFPSVEPTALTVTATIQSVAIVVQSTVAPAIIVSSATPEALLSSTPEIFTEGPPTPANMIDREDTITEQQLATQIKQDTGDNSLSDLTIQLTTEQITAISIVTVFPGIQQQIEASGSFVVESDSLVFHTTVIRIDGVDVTAQYRGQLESQINTSLYRLLPGRYVQSFELLDGEVRVISKVRP